MTFRDRLLGTLTELRPVLDEPGVLIVGSEVPNLLHLRLPLPKPGHLMAEKLLTDRTGEKGARDLLVVAGLLVTCTSADLDELISVTRALSQESRHAVRSGLTMLSLMDGRPGMPDPAPVRDLVSRLLSRIEAIDA